MKRCIQLLVIMLIAGYGASAQVITVDKGTQNTVKGVAGNLELTYAFAKGDRVSIAAHASKLLERMQIIQYPEIRIGQIMRTKDASYNFTMKDNGFVTFKFISDRGGTNSIQYSITRTPASSATRNYVTKVEWVKATDHVAPPTPRQAGQ